MAELTFEEIVQAAQRLNPEQKALLVERLELPDLDMGPTREALIAELDDLRRTGAFDNVESMRNIYHNAALDDLTDEQLLADIHEAATEWEKELDEFFGDED